MMEVVPIDPAFAMFWRITEGPIHQIRQTGAVTGYHIINFRVQTARYREDDRVEEVEEEFQRLGWIHHKGLLLETFMTLRKQIFLPWMN